jgi:thymidylate synthase (FAD)
MAKFISPSYQIVSPATEEEGVALLRRIEQFSRISHRSEDRMTDESWLKFIQFVVMEKSDWSVAEHASASVVFRINRGITHEFVRHRLFSYTQESTRFVNYGKKDQDGNLVRQMEFTIPLEWDKDELTPEEHEVWEDYRMGCIEEEQRYMRQLGRKVKPQIARDSLPHGLASTIAVTGNLRNWRHAFMMRTSKETHPEFRRVLEPCLRDFQERIPILFDDIVPGYKQSEAQSKPR